MATDLLSLPKWRQRILALPTDRAISLGRVLLACTILLALSINPPPEPTAAYAVAVIGTAYAVFALATVALSFAPARTWIPVAQHGTDIATASALTYFGDTPSFFLLFMFSLIVGLLRWNWRGSLSTAALVASAILFVPAQFEVTPDGLKLLNADLSRAVFRGGFVLVCGAMLAYLGAHRERSRRRFAQLAAWPASRISHEPQSMASSLAHAGMVLQVPRLLVIYDEVEEPDRHVLLWREGILEEHTVRADVYGSLVAESHADETFLITPALARTVFNARLQEAFGISSAATAPFQTPVCTGRLFLLDRETWIDEDLPVLKIIATRIGVELQDRILRRDLEAALVSRERVRLGRDLHDGILQSLAAASIQLRVLGTKLDPELLGAVVPIRDILAGEAARIRAFVEQTRTEPVSPPRAELGSELRQRAEILAQRWDCAVDVAMKHIIEIPHLTASHLCFILDEAVSNAVRHGKARHILVSVSADDACLEMTVRDDGVGFPESRGTGAIWPLSLRGRIEDIGGTLEISSSDRGTILMVRLVV